MHPDLSLFFICDVEAAGHQMFKYLRVFRWQKTSNIRSVRGSWLSTSQENPSPLALPGTLFTTVIRGSNGKPTCPMEPGCTREVAEAHWQHGNWWHSSGLLQGTTPCGELHFSSSLDSFSVSICTLTNAKASSQNRFSLTCTTKPSLT